jgi:type IV pilus assembly protein PilA
VSDTESVRVNQPKENRMLRFKDRLAREEGFTLIELLVVVAIIGILLAIAVPSYLGFKDSANQRAASADVRAAVPSAEQLYADTGSYATISVAVLTGYDNGLDVDHAVPVGGGTSYCIDKTVSGKVSKVTRGAAPVNGGKVQENAGAC